MTALPTRKTADAPTADEPDVDVHAADESDDVAAEKSTSTGSRRRKSRRSRANLEQASVRAALHDDDAEQDESLFGELPGFHDGGDVHQLHDVEDDALDEADLVVEGDANLVTEPAVVAEMAELWASDGWPCRVDESGTALTADFSAPSAGPPPWYVYRVTPRRATVLQTVEPGGATLFDFDAQ